MISPDEALKRLRKALESPPRTPSAFRNPLDVIGYLRCALMHEAQDRDDLLRKIFVCSPLPYWEVTRWGRRLNISVAQRFIAEATSEGWQFDSLIDGKYKPPSLELVIKEIARRYDEFDPDLYACWGENEVAMDRYVLGRDLARSYLVETASQSGNLQAKRMELLENAAHLYSEWLRINGCQEIGNQKFCEAVCVATDHLIDQVISDGKDGVGRTKVLLEHPGSSSGTIAHVTASVYPLPVSLTHLDGLVVPNIREFGSFSLSQSFMSSVKTSWEYSRHRHSRSSSGPIILCFSVRPSSDHMVEQLSGRSAEASILAAIESAFSRRLLRHDAAASAKIQIEENNVDHDPRLGPVSFGKEKFEAARDHHIQKIYLDSVTASDWRGRQKQDRIPVRGDDPSIISSELFFRDVQSSLEVKSLWQLAVLVPAVVMLAFSLLACLWQLLKLSSVNNSVDLHTPNFDLPFIWPSLFVAELICLFLTLMILGRSWRSCARSLDSHKSALVAMLVCVAWILVATFVPIGVRNEGFIDNPLYSVLFGQPQITSGAVSVSGGVGGLAIHAITQVMAYVAILFGVTAIGLRLRRSRAASETLMDDRVQLTKDDYQFCLGFFRDFVILLLIFGLVRNGLWHLYLETLPGIEIVNRNGSLSLIFAPLVGVTCMLFLGVIVVWGLAVRIFLERIVSSTEMYFPGKSVSFVESLPMSARLVLGRNIVIRKQN